MSDAEGDDVSAGRFLLLLVGCLECGVPTSAIGRYPTMDEARQASDPDADVWGPFTIGERPDYEPHGYECFVVIDLEPAPTSAAPVGA